MAAPDSTPNLLCPFLARGWPEGAATLDTTVRWLADSGLHLDLDFVGLQSIDNVQGAQLLAPRVRQFLQARIKVVFSACCVACHGMYVCVCTTC